MEAGANALKGGLQATYSCWVLAIVTRDVKNLYDF